MGIRRAEDGTLVVEEIKSIRRGGQLAAVTREVYERQALLYAWMLARQGESRRAQRTGADRDRQWALVDHQPVDGEPRTSRGVRSSDASIGSCGEFESRLAPASGRATSRRPRRSSFPHDEVAPGSGRVIVDAVELALEQREHLLLEAPTGIGKTVATLYPALRYALANDKKVFVLTAKNLQQEMATAVLAHAQSR